MLLLLVLLLLARALGRPPLTEMLLQQVTGRPH